jgi:hypothetical protein
VQHPNGTDITVGIGAGRIVVTDGTTPLSIRPDQAGGLNPTWLPGGEVTLGLDPGIADGRLVVERILLDGQAIGPVTFTYAGGQLQALESDMGIPALRPYIDPAVPLSEHLTGLKFGLNPDVADPRVLPLMGAGMFSFSMGSNSVCLAATSTCLSCSSSRSPARPCTRMNNSCSMPGCPPSLGDLNHEDTPDRCRKEFVEGARITIRRTPRLRAAVGQSWQDAQ